jgi:spore coat polysaccharide biosynthesis protein SpsF
MLQLGQSPAICHVVQRTLESEMIDRVVVATSEHKRDDIIEVFASNAGASVYRGDENDVLGRMYGSAKEYDADIVVRITGDCPLIDPEIVDLTINTLIETNADYVSNTVQRTFPRGLDTEVFTMESFERVVEKSEEPYEREHVTPYYKEHMSEFEIDQVTSDMVFDEPQFKDRTDIRITLDEYDDYSLLSEVFDEFGNDGRPDIRSVIRFIDSNNLTQINESVEQKTLD